MVYLKDNHRDDENMKGKMVNFMVKDTKKKDVQGLKIL